MVCTLVGTNSSNSKCSIPLHHINIQSTILNCLESTTIKQSYENTFSETINEVKYNFTLIPAAIITGLTSKFSSGLVLRAKFSEKIKAKQTYIEATESNKVSHLLEKNYDGSYTILIGNFEKDSSIELSISYINCIKDSTFIFPTNICPKYMPVDIQRSAIQTTYSSSTQSTPYTFNVSIDWTTADKITDVQLISSHVDHVIDKNSEKHAFININSLPTKGDIIIKLVCELVGISSVYTYTDEKYGYIGILKSVPEVVIENETSVNREFIFLLDRSGSMEGKQIEDAKKALILFLNSLPENSTFNVVSFGTNYESLFATPQKYTNSNLTMARSKINSFKADMGGTELYRPMDYILKQKIDESSERVLILLTDGDVGHSQTYLTKYGAINNLRLFCIGIGSGVNRQVLKELADKLNGLSDVISDSKYIGENITKYLKMLKKEIISIKSLLLVDSDGSQVDQKYYKLEDRGSYFAGQEFISFLRIPLDKFNNLSSLKLVFKSGNLTTYITELPVVEFKPCDNKLAKFFGYCSINSFTNTIEAAQMSVEVGIVNQYCSLILVVDDTQVEPGHIKLEVPHYNESLANLDEQCEIMLTDCMSNQQYALKSCVISKGIGSRNKLHEELCDMNEIMPMASLSRNSSRGESMSMSLSPRSRGPESSGSLFTLPDLGISEKLSSAKKSLSNLWTSVKTNLTPRTQQYVPTSILSFQNADGSFHVNNTDLWRLIGKTSVDVNQLVRDQRITKQQAVYILLLDFLKGKPEYQLILEKTQSYYNSKYVPYKAFL
jgi:hypothetical protein